VARVTSLPHEPSHNMPVLAGHNYSIPTLSQPNYNASRYQVGADVFDFADSLDPNRKADISSVPWLQNTTSFSHEYNNRLDLFYNTFAYAYQNDLVNIDTIKTTTCFGQETSRYPGAEAFNGNEALGYGSMFCNGVVRTNLRYAVASTVSGNLTNFTNIYGLTATDKGSGGNLVIATIADPATFIQNRKLEQFLRRRYRQRKGRSLCLDIQRHYKPRK
jgi:hypothetical protein